MKHFTLLTTLLLSFTFFSLQAQEEEAKAKPARSITPKNMLELTPHGGILFVSGDVRALPGWAAGLSLRKATDYIFSIRLDLLYGDAQGEGPGVRTFETNWMGVTGFGVFSFNTMRFDRSVRKSNLYGMVGAGANFFEVKNFTSTNERGSRPRETSPHITGGAGISFRLSQRFNLGIEHQASLLLGRRADLLDGVELEITGIRSPFRDILHYANVRLNFNLGNPSNQTEPLYWINPLQVVLDDIQELKEGRSGYVLRDSDGDGVPDEFDLEPNTPPGAIVDTRGRTLDSDRDGIPDHLDKEPYYTPREGEIVNSEGVVINPIARGGVTEDRVKELIQEALRDFQPAAGASGGAVLTDMFLPMIHFGVSSTTIKFSDYGTLASIGRILRDNANMRLVVTGYTDQTGSETQNQILSYERAKIVIDHLVNNHGVGRGRLVLHWGGQEEQLVPSSSSYMNRRVEFRVAKPNDVEMDPPANYGSKSDRY